MSKGGFYINRCYSKDRAQELDRFLLEFLAFAFSWQADILGHNNWIFQLRASAVLPLFQELRTWHLILWFLCKKDICPQPGKLGGGGNYQISPVASCGCARWDPVSSSLTFKAQDTETSKLPHPVWIYFITWVERLFLLLLIWKIHPSYGAKKTTRFCFFFQLWMLVFVLGKCLRGSNRHIRLCFLPGWLFVAFSLPWNKTVKHGQGFTQKSDIVILPVPNLNKTDFSGIFTFYELMVNFIEIPRHKVLMGWYEEA